ncbi:ACT domain-containing protein [Nocardioides convexus]|uniref:ACT domain-containing protein n=1 Tax=Nocardioides convexus TaxID=2712224 RepID=UPI0024184544|nr:ACT domain-containing protein [Nocardioides convexus]
MSGEPGPRRRQRPGRGHRRGRAPRHPADGEARPVFTAVAGEVAQSLDVEVRGEIAETDVKVLGLAALKGVFSSVVEDQVSYVNAPLLAAERGLAVRLITESDSPDHRNLITLRGALADGSQVSVSGTLVGIHQRERLVEVNGFDIDIEPTDHLAFFTYVDRPGMVGTVGQVLGQAGVNIAGMQVSREDKGGEALVALSVDSAISAETLAEIEIAIEATSIRAVDL